MADHAAATEGTGIKPSSDVHAYLLNPHASAEQVAKSSKRLFSREECRLELSSLCAHDQAPHKIMITDPETFLTSVNGVTASKVATRIFYIYQSYTWSNFEITEDLFNALMSSLDVYPTLLDIVQLFGQKPGPVEESFTLFFDNITLSPEPGLQGNKKCGFEIGYAIKYVERHGRTYPTDPFSIRDTGIYHKWDNSTEQHNWIFMQVSDTTKAGVERLCSQVPELCQFQIHAAILLGASENWRYYTNYLEKIFSKLIDLSFFTKVKSPVTNGELSVDFSDIQNLQILTDKLHQISQILTLNMNIGSQVQKFVKRLKSAWLPLDSSSTWVFDECDAKIEESIFVHRIHKGRIDSMLERSRGVSGLIRTTLEFRAMNLSIDTNLKNREINENVRDITKQGVEENSYMKHLVYQSTRDTRSMTIIALITAIFLPATLVATLFGSNFFGFEDNDGSANLRVASNFWIYVVTTVTLLCITFSVWWWCLRVSRSRDVDEESSGDQIRPSKKAQMKEAESVVTGSGSTPSPEIYETWDGKIF